MISQEVHDIIEHTFEQLRKIVEERRIEQFDQNDRKSREQETSPADAGESSDLVVEESRSG